MSTFTPNQLSIIGPTIRATAKAHAGRLFKTETNTPQRAFAVFHTIEAEVDQALNDAGIPWETILNEIDPSDIIFEEMKAAGFVTELPAA